MAKSQLCAARPGDFEVAKEEIAAKKIAQAKNLPIANPNTERAIKPSFQGKNAILVKHW